MELRIVWVLKILNTWYSRRFYPSTVVVSPETQWLPKQVIFIHECLSEFSTNTPLQVLHLHEKLCKLCLLLPNTGFCIKLFSVCFPVSAEFHQCSESFVKQLWGGGTRQSLKWVVLSSKPFAKTWTQIAVNVILYINFKGSSGFTFYVSVVVILAVNCHTWNVILDTGR